MQKNNIITAIALIEILIGSLTFLATFCAVVFSYCTKTPNILAFVFATSLTSTWIGVGLLRFQKTAHRLLVYFSSVVFLSKLLLLSNIITLNGALETSISPDVKNIVSLFYHGFLVVYLSQRGVKKLFNK